MKVAPEVQQTLLLLAVGGIAAFFIVRKAGKAVEEVGDIAATKLNPLSDQNFAYEFTGEMFGFFTGSDKSLGSQLYDVSETFGDYLAETPERAKSAVVDTVGTRFNPVSEENIIYQGFNMATSAVVGEETSLGSAIYGGVEAIGNWWDELTGGETQQ